MSQETSSIELGGVDMAGVTRVERVWVLTLIWMKDTSHNLSTPHFLAQSSLISYTAIETGPEKSALAHPLCEIKQLGRPAAQLAGLMRPHHLIFPLLLAVQQAWAVWEFSPPDN